MQSVNQGKLQLWIHGNAGTLQTTHLCQAERLSSYFRVKAAGPVEAWIHYALPTVIPESGARLMDVSIRFRTFREATIGRVEAWDAERQFMAHEKLSVRSLTGEALQIGDQGDRFARLTFTLNAPYSVESGIGLSLLFIARAKLDAIAVSGVGFTLVTG
jgi:hypothetical protein